MSAIGRFNNQLSHLSKIPFASLSPLRWGGGGADVTSFGSEQQVSTSTVCVGGCARLCMCVHVRVHVRVVEYSPEE